MVCEQVIEPLLGEAGLSCGLCGNFTPIFAIMEETDCGDQGSVYLSYFHVS